MGARWNAADRGSVLRGGRVMGILITVTAIIALVLVVGGVLEWVWGDEA